MAFRAWLVSLSIMAARLVHVWPLSVLHSLILNDTCSILWTRAFCLCICPFSSWWRTSVLGALIRALEGCWQIPPCQWVGSSLQGPRRHSMTRARSSVYFQCLPGLASRRCLLSVYRWIIFSPENLILSAFHAPQIQAMIPIGMSSPPLLTCLILPCFRVGVKVCLLQEAFQQCPRLRLSCYLLW